MIKTIKNNSYLFAIGFPLGFLSLLLNKFGVNFPYLDQWAYVPLHMKIDSGTFGISDLWAQHNEHRIVFPKIASLSLSLLTHWYTPVEIFFSVFIAIIGIILISKMLNNAVKAKAQVFILTTLTASWFFSPIQWQNWLWGFQMAWFMCVTSVIATVYYLDKFSNIKNYRSLWMAIVCATIATYSLGSGMLIWPVGFALLLVYSLLKTSSRKILYIWTGIGLFEIFAYYFGYVKPAYHPSVFLAVQYPGSFLKYIVTALGRPFTNNVDVAYAMGLIMVSLLLCGMALTIHYGKKLKLASIAKWYALIFYGLFGLVMTAVTRLGFGISAAMNSRYTAFSLLILVSTIGLFMTLINMLESRKPPTWLPIIILSLICLPMLFQSYKSGYAEMKQQSILNVHIKTCTSLPYPSDECISETYPPDVKLARTWLEYMKANHYAGY